MSDQPVDVGIRPWTKDDFEVVKRVMGDPAMTVHLGGPESPEKLRERHERYTRYGKNGKMFVIVVGPDRVPAGSVGYWEQESGGERVWETGWSVYPEFQGMGIASKATALVIEKVRAEGTHRYLHAFPKLENGPSNGICRKLGFRLLGEEEFEYPPGNPIRSNNWRLDLQSS